MDLNILGRKKKLFIMVFTTFWRNLSFILLIYLFICTLSPKNENNFTEGLGYRVKTNIQYLEQVCRGSVLHGGLSKRSYPVFTLISEKTTESSERLGRQVRPEIEPGTSRQPVLRAESLGY